MINKNSISIKKKSMPLLIIFLIVPFLQVENFKLITLKLIDHGHIKENTVITDHISFINKSEEFISIKKIKLSCGCTTAKYNHKKIMPGDTAIIEYIFDSKNYRGVIRKKITIFFNEKNIEPLYFTIQANILRQFDINPQYLDFRELNYNPDTTVTRSLEIINRQNKKLYVKKIHSNNPFIQITPQSFIIKPKSSKTITINYTPAQKGFQLSHIIIESDYSQRLTIRFSAFINVKNYK